MIRRLRDRHRRLIAIVAVATGMALLWALTARAGSESPVAPASHPVPGPAR